MHSFVVAQQLLLVFSLTAASSGLRRQSEETLTRGFAQADSTPAAGRHQALDPALVTPDQTPADTGRMAWGHHDFHDYTSPLQCEGAITIAAGQFRRTRAIDSMALVPAAAPLPAGVRAVADACGAAFTAMTVAPDALWSVFRIALVRNDWVQAMAVVQRERALAPASADQADTLAMALTLAISASPAWTQLADTLFRQLDAIGSAGRIGAFQGHVAFIRYWYAQYVPDSVRAHALAALALLRDMPDAERESVDAPVPYLALTYLASAALDMAEAQHWLQQGEQMINTWHHGAGQQRLDHGTALLRIQQAAQGKVTPTLRVPYTFHTDGTVSPALGRITLLIHISPGCDVSCQPLYTLVRQLHHQYATALDLTLLTETRGYAVGSGPLPSADEAKQWGSYYLDLLHLPVAVLVDETPLQKRGDGHVEREIAPTSQLFDQWSDVNAVLIDRTGTVAWVGAIQSTNDIHEVEAVVRTMISATTNERH